MSVFLGHSSHSRSHHGHHRDSDMERHGEHTYEELSSHVDNHHRHAGYSHRGWHQAYCYSCFTCICIGGLATLCVILFLLLQRTPTYPVTFTDVDAVDHHNDHLCKKAIPSNVNLLDDRLQRQTCLGAPFLYVTYHGGKGSSDVRTVCKYSRDGCSYGSALLKTGMHTIYSLRDMYLQQGYLIVAESWRRNSQLLLYDDCDSTKHQRRKFLASLITAKQQAPAMIHPYGLAKNPKDPYTLYVSAQGTNTVLKFFIDYPKNQTNKYHPSLMALQFTDLVASLGEDDIRGIAFDDSGKLYVSNKQKGLLVYNEDGVYLKRFTDLVEVPIALFYDKLTKLLWVGSSASHNIYSFNTSDASLVREISHKRLRHPAGIVVHDGSVYVISQKKRQLLRFSTETGELQDVVLKKLPDSGEHIILSPC